MIIIIIKWVVLINMGGAKMSDSGTVVPPEIQPTAQSNRASRKMRLSLMGPAFIAAIGYIDPGNFATNIQAGSTFGYQLL